MKKYIIGAFLFLPAWFWLTYVCGLSTLETIATAFIFGVTFGIYNVVLEESEKA